MGDTQTKERAAASGGGSGGGDGAEGRPGLRSTKSVGAQGAATAVRARRATNADEGGRRRAKTTGAETSAMAESVVTEAERCEMIAKQGKNPTITQPKGFRVLGMRFLDPSISGCVGCGVGFTTTNRRHWCRRCGRIFCEPCSAKRHTLYTGGPPLRVCRACANPGLFKLPINLLQKITTYLAPKAMAPVLSTCHRFQLSINLPYNEVRNIHDTYDKSQTRYLQKGAFGCVYAARHSKTKAGAAIKVIDKYHVYSLREWRFIKREIDLHQGLRHPSIVQLLEVHQTRSKVYIVMELGKGDLFDYMMDRGYMTETEVTSIAVQLLVALEYLHTVAHVVHRDIKPENILVFPARPGPATTAGVPPPTGPPNGARPQAFPTVKLCDFGLAKRFEVTQEPAKVSCTPCGTLSYCPPEVLSKTLSTTTDRLCKLDIYSLGIVLHVLISGSEPFKGKSPSDILRSMKQSVALSGKEWKAVSEPMRNTVQSMLRFNTPSRPTATEALALLHSSPVASSATSAPWPEAAPAAATAATASTPETPAAQLPAPVPPAPAAAAAAAVSVPAASSAASAGAAGTAPIPVSAAESVGMEPLVETQTYRERIAESVQKGFGFRLQDEGAGDMKLEVVDYVERRRGSVMDVDQREVEIRTAQDFQCLADDLNDGKMHAVEPGTDRIDPTETFSDIGSDVGDRLSTPPEVDIPIGAVPQRSACIPMSAQRRRSL